MDKNRAMKWKSYGNEANVLHEAMLKNNPIREIVKPNCHYLTEKWFDEM